VGSVLQDDLGLLFLEDHSVFHLSKILPGSQVGAGGVLFIQLSPTTEQRA
jgi:hypothetical protein